MDCLICNSHEADETGSHIIPHSVIESMVNDGAKGRDKEKSFQLGNGGSTSFIGRSVLPDQVEATLGRELSDEEIASSANPYVRDYIFCKSCEKKLSHFESLYKTKVATRLSNGQSLTPEQAKIAYFFWLSILYRGSVTDFSFKLEPKLEAALGAITNSVLADSEAETEKNCQALEVTFNLSICFFMPTEDSSRNLVLQHPETANPYVFSINQYLVVFNYSIPQVPQLERALGVSLGIAGEGISIKTFTVSERKAVLGYFWKLVGAYKRREFITDFIEHYQKANSVQPSHEVIEAFFTELTSPEELETVKYAVERVEELTKKYSQLR